MVVKLYGREEEIRALFEYVKLGKNILLKGRRGIGKTALVKELVKRVKDLGFNSLYVNCESITTPKTLLDFVGLSGRKQISTEEILPKFFEEISRKNIQVLVLDEFTLLIRDLSKRKPYRGVEKVIAHLRSLLEEYSGSVILTASTLWTISRLMKNYERRLARMFPVVLTLGPLTINDAAKLAFDIVGLEGVAYTIASLGDAVPFYVEALSLTQIRISDPYMAFQEELTRGALNELFRALFNDLPPVAREVIYLLAQGPKNYESLEKEVLDDTLSFALDYLQEMDLIGKTQRKKRTLYFLKDKTFGAWVSLNKTPSLYKDIKKITRILAIGFESIIRELFLSINMEIDIKDANGRVFKFGPVDYSRRVELNGEIDMLAQDTAGRTLIGEITIRENIERKIKQLSENNKKVRDKLGIKDAKLLLITYKEPGESTLRKAKKLDIYVLTRKELNNIAKIVGYRPI